MVGGQRRARCAGEREVFLSQANPIGASGGIGRQLSEPVARRLCAANRSGAAVGSRTLKVSGRHPEKKSTGRHSGSSNQTQQPSVLFTRIAMTRPGVVARLMMRMLFTPLGML